MTMNHNKTKRKPNTSHTQKKHLRTRPKRQRPINYSSFGQQLTVTCNFSTYFLDAGPIWMEYFFPDVDRTWCVLAWQWRSFRFCAWILVLMLLLNEPDISSNTSHGHFGFIFCIDKFPVVRASKLAELLLDVHSSIQFNFVQLMTFQKNDSKVYSANVTKNIPIKSHWMQVLSSFNSIINCVTCCWDNFCFNL